MINEKVFQQKFIEACQKLDASIFEPYISEDRTIDEMDKYRFLAELKGVLDKVKEKGVKLVDLHMSVCKGCVFGHETHEFHSNGGFEFAYLIKSDSEELVDMQICNLSGGFWEVYTSPEETAKRNETNFKQMAKKNDNLQKLKDNFDLGFSDSDF